MKCIGALAAFLWFLAAHVGCTPALTIAENGVAEAVIVVASEAEQHAADELAGFLLQITGARFATVNQAAGD